MKRRVVAKKNSASSSKMQHRTFLILITTLLENQTGANLGFSTKVCNFKGLSLCQLSKESNFSRKLQTSLLRKNKLTITISKSHEFCYCWLLKPSISSHSRPCTMCFVLQHSVIKTKHLRSLVQRLV